MDRRNNVVRVAVVIVLLLVIVPYVPVGAWPLPDTGSMEPTMTGCDLLVYGPADDVAVGDVVIFDAPWRDGLVIHRVVEQTPRGYVLQGDANSRPDPMLVPGDRLVAEIQYVAKTGPLVEGICHPVSNAAMTAYESSNELLPV